MQASLYRKVAYGILLAILLYLLYVVGSPARVVKEGGDLRTNPGGLLAQYRTEIGVTEAQIGKIDPASSTAKLATFGMRGIAISLLWHQVMEQQKRHEWNDVVAIANQIIFLEPHFITIWDFLGWTLAYNASAEFDDYRERYRWVIRGIDFLIAGVERNRKAPKLYGNAGWTISQKIGIADEVEQYRRLLRNDEDFGLRHGFPLPSDRDNWMLGRIWYHQGEQLVLDGVANLGNQSDFVYFANSRLNLFNYAKWKRKDGIFGDEAIRAWDNAIAEWREFGKMELGTAIPDDGTLRMTKKNVAKRAVMETTDIVRAEEKALLAELNEIAPDLKETLIIARWQQLGETAQGSLLPLLEQAYELTATYQPIEELQLVRKWLDANEPDWKARLTTERNALFPEDQAELRKIPTMFLDEEDRAALSKIDGEVAQAQQQSLEILRLIPRILAEEIQELDVPRDKKSRAREIVSELDGHKDRTRMSDLFRGILNYESRFKDVEIERTHTADGAHRLRYDARKAYYDGKLAESLGGWLDAMRKWDEVLDEFPDRATDGDFMREHIDIAEKFLIILDDSNKIFSDVSEDPVPLRRLMWFKVFREAGGAAEGSIALEYAKKAYEQALAETNEIKQRESLEKVEQYFLTVARHYEGINYREKFMEYAPFFDLRDQALEAAAYYIRTLEKQGKSLPEPLVLRSYIELMLAHDPAVAAANAILIDALPLLRDQKYGEAETALDGAVAAWQSILTKYPLIAHDPTNSAYGDVARLTAQYIEVMRALEKPIPEEFPLKMFVR